MADGTIRKGNLFLFKDGSKAAYEKFKKRVFSKTENLTREGISKKFLVNKVILDPKTLFKQR